MIKLLNLKRQFYLLVLFLSVTSTLIAQNSNEKQKLQGTWILEEASILKIEGRDSIKTDINNVVGDLDLGIFSSLKFENEKLELLVKGASDPIIGVPEITEGNLFLDFLARNYIFIYKQDKDSLFLIQNYRREESFPWYYLITTKYIKQ